MEITLKNLQKKTPIPKAKILKAAKAGIKGTQYLILSIVFVGTKRMREINKKYLKHDYVTDVLTFDLGQSQAEIIICPQVARTNAKEYRTSTESEIVLYVVHGLLHLAGFDDHSPQDITRMRKMENKLLKK